LLQLVPESSRPLNGYNKVKGPWRALERNLKPTGQRWGMLAGDGCDGWAHASPAEFKDLPQRSISSSWRW